MSILKRIANQKVEWKRLGDVCDFQNGFAFKREKFREKGEYPVIKIKNIQDNKINLDDVLYINEKDYKEDLSNYELKKGDIVIAMSGATVAKIGIYLLDDKCYINQRVGKFIPKKELNNLYLYYYLQYKYFNIYKMAIGSGAQPNLSSNDFLNKFLIPIPPLDLQEEIVEILDKFTKYVTELKTELKMRIKQYNYYRDMLLSEEYLNKLMYVFEELVLNDEDILNMAEETFKKYRNEVFARLRELKEIESKVEIKTLGEIGKFSMCKRILKDQTLEIGEIPFYKIGTFGKEADSYITRELFEEYKSKYNYPKKGDILISASGTIGKMVIFDGKDSYFQDSNIIWLSHNEDIILNRYLYYFYQMVDWKVMGSTIKRLYTYNLNKIKILIPSIPIQKRIVRVLDKFEELTNEISGLLPHEIELREKQYRYYLEKLLTFAEEYDSLQEPSRAFKYLLAILEEAEAILGIRNSELEFKKFEDILDYEQPNKYIVSSTEYNNKNKVPVLTAGKTFILGYTNEDFNIYNANKENPVIIFDDFTASNRWVDFEFKVKSSVMKILKPRGKTGIRYCYYHMKKLKFENSEHNRVWISKYSKIQIPTPPLPVQHFLVRILDKFDKLTNDISGLLPYEIELREKQYEYHRDKLLAFRKA